MMVHSIPKFQVMKKTPCRSLLTLLILAVLAITACKNLPVASFTLSSNTAEVGDTVHFINTSQDADAFEWDFGDGDGSTEENPSHVYTAVGTFNIKLVVSNDDGSDEAGASISISSQSGTLTTVTVHSTGLEGNLLGDSPDRLVTIYLPPGYESSDKNYPVVYLLHGYGPDGDNLLWFGAGYVPVNLKPIMDQLIYNGSIEPMILVSPNSKNRFGGSWYINSISSGYWEDFIAKDVVEFVDNNYRTIPNPGSRGITGHSMGGYGTVMIAMRNPEVFGAAYALSASILAFEEPTYGADYFGEIDACDDIADFESLSYSQQVYISRAVAMIPNPSAPPFYIEKLFNSSGELVDSIWQRVMLHDPYTSITTYADNLLQLNAIRLDCGKFDGNIQDNILFANQLDTIGIPNAFESYTGDHADKLEERMWLKVLPFFSVKLEHE
jgi:enterochelin esterase-like enzyme